MAPMPLGSTSGHCVNVGSLVYYTYSIYAGLSESSVLPNPPSPTKYAGYGPVPGWTDRRMEVMG